MKKIWIVVDDHNRPMGVPEHSQGGGTAWLEACRRKTNPQARLAVFVQAPEDASPVSGVVETNIGSYRKIGESLRGYGEPSRYWIEMPS